MAKYQYRAKEDSGNTIDGVIEADSSDEAVEKINRLGYLPIKVAEVSAPSGKEEPNAPAAKIQLFSG